MLRLGSPSLQYKSWQKYEWMLPSANLFKSRQDEFLGVASVDVDRDAVTEQQTA
jgi:hypothetical protein